MNTPEKNAYDPSGNLVYGRRNHLGAARYEIVTADTAHRIVGYEISKLAAWELAQWAANEQGRRMRVVDTYSNASRDWEFFTSAENASGYRVFHKI